MSQCRNWVFTYNNPTYEPEAFLELVQSTSAFRFVAFQEEVGASGTRHFQGVLSFSRQKRLQTVKNQLGVELHLEIMRGTMEQAYAYATKEDTRVRGPWQAGEMVVERQRTDLHRATQLLKEKGLAYIKEELPEVYARYPKGLDALEFHRVESLQRDSDNVKVTLLIGNPGCGKTRKVLNDVPAAELYHHEPGDAWYDGYHGQPVVLLDDFCGAASGMRLDKALRFLDRYRVRLPVKGSFTYLVATRVIITTNIHPAGWYKWEDRSIHYLALKRRIQEVVVFEEDDTDVLLTEEMREKFFGEDLRDIPIPGTKFGSWEMPAISLYQ